ncbi:MAG: L-rhamnose mutarotase [Planctomycetota bacterium]
MERVAFVLKVRPDRLADYKARHRTVWPEMLSALRACGWRNYSLFLRSDGTLFGYLETSSFLQALEAMAARDVNARWQREMAPFFENTAGRPADQALERLEEVFHLD